MKTSKMQNAHPDKYIHVSFVYTTLVHLKASSMYGHWVFCHNSDDICKPQYKLFGLVPTF
jgi:hypothetical protein